MPDGPGTRRHEGLAAVAADHGDPVRDATEERPGEGICIEE